MQHAPYVHGYDGSCQRNSVVRYDRTDYPELVLNVSHAAADAIESADQWY